MEEWKRESVLIIQQKMTDSEQHEKQFSNLACSVPAKT